LPAHTFAKLTVLADPAGIGPEPRADIEEARFGLGKNTFNSGKGVHTIAAG